MSELLPPITETLAAFQTAFEGHDWYKRRIDGTPLSNDLAVIADRVMREIMTRRIAALPITAETVRRVGQAIEWLAQNVDCPIGEDEAFEAIAQRANVEVKHEG